MGDFFKGWKRKLGVVTLLGGCLFVAGWGRSLVTIDRLSIPTGRTTFYYVTPLKGDLIWQRVVPDEASRPSNDPNFSPAIFREAAECKADFVFSRLICHDVPVAWTPRYWGPEIGEFSNPEMLTSVGVRASLYKLSYWYVITPLTLLSAFFLLSKPRRMVQRAD